MAPVHQQDSKPRYLLFLYILVGKKHKSNTKAPPVRGMINRFLDSGAMKKGAFADALGVSGNSLRSFLTSSGMKGAQSATYTEALRFFKQREDAGIKEVKKAKAKPAAATTTAATIDISGITLDGELEGNVEVYDTCDEIRKFLPSAGSLEN